MSARDDAVRIDSAADITRELRAAGCSVKTRRDPGVSGDTVWIGSKRRTLGSLEQDATFIRRSWGGEIDIDSLWALAAGLTPDIG